MEYRVWKTSPALFRSQVFISEVEFLGKDVLGGFQVSHFISGLQAFKKSFKPLFDFCCFFCVKFQVNSVYNVGFSFFIEGIAALLSTCVKSYKSATDWPLMTIRHELLKVLWLKGTGELGLIHPPLSKGGVQGSTDKDEGVYNTTTRKEI